MKKKMAMVGIINSVLVVVVGILFLLGVFGGEGSYPSGAPSYYDTGYASFGADFYTYVNNNTAEAASATYRTAANVRSVGHLLKNFCGIFLICLGSMGISLFAVLRCDGKAEKTVLPAPEFAPVTPGYAPVAPAAPEMMPSEQ